MITTIIFDIGNVLVDFRWKEFIAGFGYDEAMQERIAKASVLSDDWNEYDLGLLNEDEIIDKFIENDPGIADELKDTYRSLDGLLKQFDHAKPWISELKARGFKVLYLSNFSAKAERECAKELDFIPLTDGGILSYKVRMTKPDPRIYELLTATYSLVPQDCLFFFFPPGDGKPASAL
jgi:putative hydrolase of the HAD superfamily